MKRLLWQSAESASGIPDRCAFWTASAGRNRRWQELTAGDEDPDLKAGAADGCPQNRIWNGFQKGAPQCFAVMAAMLPVEITGKAACRRALRPGFWALLEELRSFGWDGGDCWTFGIFRRRSRLPRKYPRVPALLG